jgi:hypothetical protein
MTLDAYSASCTIATSASGSTSARGAGPCSCGWPPAPQRAQRRQHARLDRGVDGADDDGVLGRVDQRPAARALLPGLVEDDVDQRPPGVGVDLLAARAR